jgi:hypothetical protein
MPPLFVSALIADSLQKAGLIDRGILVASTGFTKTHFFQFVLPMLRKSLFPCENWFRLFWNQQ